MLRLSVAVRAAAASCRLPYRYEKVVERCGSEVWRERRDERSSWHGGKISVASGEVGVASRTGGPEVDGRTGGGVKQDEARLRQVGSQSRREAEGFL